MAAEPEAEQRTQVNARVSPELKARLAKAMVFTHRKQADILTEALEGWLTSNNF